MNDMHVVFLTNQKDYVLFSCAIHLTAGAKMYFMEMATC